MILQYLHFVILALLAGLVVVINALIILFLIIDSQDNSHPTITNEQIQEIIKNTKK